MSLAKYFAGPERKNEVEIGSKDNKTGFCIHLNEVDN